MKRKWTISLCAALTAMSFAVSPISTVSVLAEPASEYVSEDEDLDQADPATLVGTDTSDKETVRVGASSYNASSAITWAKNEASHLASKNAGDSSAKYVCKCLQAGGMPIPAYDNSGDIYGWIVKNGYGAAYDISDSSLKAMEGGDIVVVLCDAPRHGKNHLGIHAFFVGDVDGKGYTCYQNRKYRHGDHYDLTNLNSYKIRCDVCENSDNSHTYIIHLNKSVKSSSKGDSTGNSKSDNQNTNGGQNSNSTRPALPSPWYYGNTPSGSCSVAMAGQFSSQVQWIQQALNVIQNTGLTVDGYFGDTTKEAVIVFQQTHTLTDDGIAGPGTTKKMVSALKKLGYAEPKDGSAGDSSTSTTASVPMYRLYNPNSSEHFYTAKSKERDSLVKVGWRYEGIGWRAPKNGKPVYRIYNMNSGDHHYTTSFGEKNSLVKAGWRDEGIGWYSGGKTPIYRQYNPNAKTGSHNFTSSIGENYALVRAGWKAEGIAWYGV